MRSMKSLRLLTPLTLAIAVIGLCGTALAIEFESDAEIWGVNPDVDQDGQVSATDIQRVINGALGVDLTEENVDPEDAVHLPIRRYVVAEPRVALTVPRINRLLMNTDVEPDPSVVEIPETDLCCKIIGSAYNFPRHDGKMVVRRGTVVYFLLGKNTQGVWYEHACGQLSAQLRLDMLDPNSEEERWIPIGRDGAAARRCGPLWGTAKIGVRHRFEEPGLYLMRASVWSHAIPAHPVDAETVEVMPRCADRAHDEIFVLVRVASGEPRPDQIDEQHIPESIREFFGLHMSEALLDLEELDQDVDPLE
jgi:hypothetical protein